MKKEITISAVCAIVLFLNACKTQDTINPTTVTIPITTLATGNITTIAGNGHLGFSGDGGSALNAMLNETNGLAVDSVGNVFVAEGGNGIIRKINSKGIISTIAGIHGQFGDTGDGGPAIAAKLDWVTDVTLDRHGNLFITDGAANVIRKITASTSVITTIAGTFMGGQIDKTPYVGDGGLATSAHLNLPDGITIGKTGSVYFVDGFNSVIRKIDGVTGVITTIGGDNANDGYYGGDNGPATSANLSNCTSLALDASGNIYIGHSDDNAIRRIDAATGILTTIAGIGNSTPGYSGDGGLATAAKMSDPQGIDIDNAGNIYIADTGNNVIRKIDASTGIITTIAGSGAAGYSGDGGFATGAKLNGPKRVVIDKSGAVYIADAGNSVIRVMKQ